jgi:putative transposase
MKRSRLTQEQIIGLFKEHQAGTTVVDLCRKHGVSDATFYMWRPNCGGMAVSDARKPKGLEEENALLKKLLAQSILDVSTLRVMLAEASDAPLAACSRNLDDPGKNDAQRRACSSVGIAQRIYRYASRRPPAASSGRRAATVRRSPPSHLLAREGQCEPEKAVPAMLVGAARRAQARMPKARPGQARANGLAAGDASALVSGLRLRRAGLQAPVPDPGRGGRLHAGAPGACGRHVAVGTAGRTRAQPDRGVA